jgi:hypothetical protein
MTTAVDIKRSDIVSFIPNPRYRSNLRTVEKLTVFGLVRDDTTTLLTFSVEGKRHQVLLPNSHPVTINQRAG